MTAWGWAAVAIAYGAALVICALQAWVCRRRVDAARHRARALVERIHAVQGWSCTGEHPHAVYQPTAAAGAATLVHLCLTQETQDAIAWAMHRGYVNNAGERVRPEVFGPPLDAEDGAGPWVWMGAASGFQFDTAPGAIILSHRCGKEWRLMFGSFAGDVFDIIIRHREETCQ